ncbi:MAG: hypothetical protein Q8M46_02910 [Thiobacillus sp.]|nr:hypothetical protein [Thiobacillus sp.]
MQTNEQSNHQTQDPVLSFFNRVISQVARVLAAVMVMVIIWGVADVVYVLYQRLGNADQCHPLGIFRPESRVSEIRVFMTPNFACFSPLNH